MHAENREDHTANRKVGPNIPSHSIIDTITTTLSDNKIIIVILPV